MRYVVLIYNRRDVYDRHFVKRDSLEEARAVAKSYEDDLKYDTEIFGIGCNLRYTDYDVR